MQQLKLWQYDKKLFGSSVVKPERNPEHLGEEKSKFMSVMCLLIDRLNFEMFQDNGRPRVNLKDVYKSLLMMAYNGMSYRRTQSDIRKMKEDGFISYAPARSTLNDYANMDETLDILSQLIQMSAFFFREEENTLILDSTWLGLKMYVGGHKKVHDKENCNFEQTRKLHIGCLKNSRVIAFAKATDGFVHDSPIFEKIVKSVVKGGFKITTLLADAGYSSKDNYALCKELGIFGAYINFKSNSTSKRAKSDLWRERFIEFKEHPEMWHEIYRFRAIVEGVFSSIKRKQRNYVRARKGISQDIELLLRCLVHNITIIGQFS